MTPNEVVQVAAAQFGPVHLAMASVTCRFAFSSSRRAPARLRFNLRTAAASARRRCGGSPSSCSVSDASSVVSSRCSSPQPCRALAEIQRPPGAQPGRRRLWCSRQQTDAPSPGVRRHAAHASRPRVLRRYQTQTVVRPEGRRCQASPSARLARRVGRTSPPVAHASRCHHRRGSPSVSRCASGGTQPDVRPGAANASASRPRRDRARLCRGAGVTRGTCEPGAAKAAAVLQRSRLPFRLEAWNAIKAVFVPSAPLDGAERSAMPYRLSADRSASRVGRETEVRPEAVHP